MGSGSVTSNVPGKCVSQSAFVNRGINIVAVVIVHTSVIVVIVYAVTSQDERVGIWEGYRDICSKQWCSSVTEHRLTYYGRLYSSYFDSEFVSTVLLRGLTHCNDCLEFRFRG